MNLLEKSKNKVVQINQAMEEYDMAQKSYDEISKASCVFYVTIGEQKVDLSNYETAINDFKQQILNDLTDVRKLTLDTAESNLLKMIGEEKEQDVVSLPVDDAEDGIGESFDLNPKAIESQNTVRPKNEIKPWLDEALLRKELVENGLGVGEFAKKYDCKKSDVYNGKSKYGINTTTVQKSTPSSAKR